jgi:hypothetical protein
MNLHTLHVERAKPVRALRRAKKMALTGQNKFRHITLDAQDKDQ